MSVHVCKCFVYSLAAAPSIDAQLLRLNLSALSLSERSPFGQCGQALAPARLMNNSLRRRYSKSMAMLYSESGRSVPGSSPDPGAWPPTMRLSGFLACSWSSGRPFMLGRFLQCSPSYVPTNPDLPSLFCPVFSVREYLRHSVLRVFSLHDRPGTLTGVVFRCACATEAQDLRLYCLDHQVRMGITSN